MIQKVDGEIYELKEKIAKEIREGNTEEEIDIHLEEEIGEVLGEVNHLAEEGQISFKSVDRIQDSVRGLTSCKNENLLDTAYDELREDLINSEIDDQEEE